MTRCYVGVQVPGECGLKKLPFPPCPSERKGIPESADRLVERPAAIKRGREMTHLFTGTKVRTPGEGERGLTLCDLPMVSIDDELYLGVVAQSRVILLPPCRSRGSHH
jgi:hypothetical protein